MKYKLFMDTGVGKRRLTVVKKLVTNKELCARVPLRLASRLQESYSV